MKQPPAHLFVDISSHGFGHIGQTVPVLNALLQNIPDLRLTLRCAAPRPFLETLIAGEFTHLCTATDFGMHMASAVAVLPEASARDYINFHHNWDERVAQESAVLSKIAPDLVLSNVSYLTLAAARHAGIPSLAMCSLNWADIFWHYCADIPGAVQIHTQILNAYNSAALFLRLQPAMPMPNLTNLHDAGTVAQKGRLRRSEINARLGLAHTDLLVLISMGGMQLQLPVNDWPRIPGVRWIVKQSSGITHPDVFAQATLDMPYIDILRSCDVLLTKPGYGNFAEAGVNGVPVLYVSRVDWPEEEYLVAWMQQHGRCQEIQHEQLERGELNAAIQTLLNQAPKPPILPDGITCITEIVAQYL